MKKTMSAAQAAHLTGKRVNRDKWQLPDGFAVCAVTDKMLPESELLVTFQDGHLTAERWALVGPRIEDADWLSEEGYGLLMDRVGAAGLMDVYCAGYEIF